MATTEAAFTPFSVGQIVQFVFGTSLARGQIIEDRGPLGAEGRHIDRLRVDHDPYDPAIFEMPEDELELVPDDDTAASRSISALEVVDYLQRGGASRHPSSRRFGGARATSRLAVQRQRRKPDTYLCRRSRCRRGCDDTIKRPS